MRHSEQTKVLYKSRFMPVLDGEPVLLLPDPIHHPTGFHMNLNNREILQSENQVNARGTDPLMLSSSSLVGNQVCNKARENVGDIKDLMLDTRNGRVEYAVLSFSTFLGMGEKLFAIPFRALTLDTENRRFILDVDKERLKEAPGFDRDDWPDMANQVWAKSIHSYYGEEYQPERSSE